MAAAMLEAAPRISCAYARHATPLTALANVSQNFNFVHSSRPMKESAVLEPHAFVHNHTISITPRSLRASTRKIEMK
jgi:hypothetical protein